MRNKLLMVLGVVASMANFSASATECSGKVTGLAVLHNGLYQVELSDAKYDYYLMGFNKSDFSKALDAYENAKTLKLTYSSSDSCSALRGDTASSIASRVDIVTSTGSGGGGCVVKGANELKAKDDTSDEQSIMMLPGCN